MRKLLLLFVCVCASIGAWATTVVTSDGEMTITSTEKGSLRNYSFTAADKAATSVVLIGEFEPTDLDAIKTNGNDFKFTSVDFSQAEIVKPQDPNKKYKLYNTLPTASESISGDDKYVSGATVYQYTNGAWTQVTAYTDGTEAKYYLADESEEKPSANNGEYLAVGGTVYKCEHNWNVNPQTHEWVLAPVKEYEWKAIKFNNWGGSIETAILPDGVLANDLDPNDLWPDPNNSKITRVESGSTYAVLTKVNNQITAEIFAASDEEFNRMKDILTRDNLVSANNIERGSTSNDYIHYDAQTGIAEVHVTEPGSFTRLFPKNTYADGTIFRFDSDCANFSADELKMMATDPSKYYVDLYDVTTSTDVESAITGAIGSMRTSNTQYKGLLLPKNPTSVGTTLIKDEQQGPGATATCSEFIAYNNQTVTMAHIYADNPVNPGNNNTYENRLAKLKAIMVAHVDDEGNKVIEKATSVYAVSTNKPTEITNVNIIKGDEDATVIHTYNNEMVKSATEPSMDVFPTEAGHFADAVQATNIKNTANLDDLKFSGDVEVSDILALNGFASGPKVLDLSQVPVEHISRNLLKDLDNDFIEYIILPAGLDEPVVADYPNLASLKCVISSNKSTDQNHVLNAYVKEAGSLAKARYLATGGIISDGAYKPTAQQLNSVKLTGNLNASDIATGNGGALIGEEANITSFDLEKAYFANVNDMVLGGRGAGLTALTEVKLPATPDDPNAPRMTEIPANCLYGIKSLQNLHIPYNYQKIGWEAFWETSINHITTEDAKGALIDNGPKTYTLSANIKELGEIGHQEGTSVFPKVYVLDVYSLAMEVPVCYAHTFHANMVYANGGLYGGPYCREKYVSDDNAITLLHFPSEESYNAATGDKENSYSDLEAKYTDPTRQYSKKDQTGAKDADGNPLAWPSQEELLLSRNQAKAGYTWAEPSTVHDNFYPNYVGWHEFVLSVTSYVDPTEIVVSKKVIRNYEDAGWFTLCIPFNMTYDQVVRILGVPKSEGNVECYLNGSTEKNSGDILPDIRTLRYVTRKPGKTNEITFLLTQDLTNGGQYSFWNINDGDPGQSGMSSCGQNAAGEKYLIRGGYPYVIKAYKRTGENIKNLGKYIMQRYGDEFKYEASCLRLDRCWEALNGTSETAKFAKPFEHHKVQAYLDVEGSGKGYTTHTDGTNYYYSFIGQFWDQPLPRYAFYMVNKDTENMFWYRYTSGTKTYTWEQYKCIILATQEVDDTKTHPNSGKYRDNVSSIYPPVTGYDSKGAEIFKQDLKIQFLNGRDDAIFSGESMAKYSFAFDDNIQEFDADGNQTNAIMKLDGVDIQGASGSGKVFNAAGQYVGNSVEGLSKGLYIVNGKKIVVQ